MARLIKDKDIILDGTMTRYEKEQEAFAKLEELESIMESHNLNDTIDLQLNLIAFEEIVKGKSEESKIIKVMKSHKIKDSVALDIALTTLELFIKLQKTKEWLENAKSED